VTKNASGTFFYGMKSALNNFLIIVLSNSHDYENMEPQLHAIFAYSAIFWFVKV